jgi:hypothetical protein
MRLLTNIGNMRDPEDYRNQANAFSAWLLRIGEGTTTDLSQAANSGIMKTLLPSGNFSYNTC